MNVAADMLTTYELAGVRGTVAAIVGDAQLGAESVTYCARGARAYSPGDGVVSHAETRTTITATISPMSETEVQATAGALRGDSTVLIAASSLSTAPRVDDRILTASAAWHVLTVEQVGIASHYRLTARKD